MSETILETAVTIIPPPVAHIEASLAPLIQRASAISITSIETHERAQHMRKLSTGLRKQIVEHHAEMKDLAYRTHKAIASAEKKLLNQCDAIDAILDPKLDRYESHAREQARLEQERLQAEARKQEEERQIAEAIQAEAEGEPEIAEAILEEPTPEPFIRVEPQIAKVEGMSTAIYYSGEVKDLYELAKYIVEQRPEDICLLDINQPNLNRRAVSQREAFNVPGCKLVKTTRRAVRA